MLSINEQCLIELRRDPISFYQNCNFGNLEDTLVIDCMLNLHFKKYKSIFIDNIIDLYRTLANTNNKIVILDFVDYFLDLSANHISLISRLWDCVYRNRRVILISHLRVTNDGYLPGKYALLLDKYCSYTVVLKDEVYKVIKNKDVSDLIE